MRRLWVKDDRDNPTHSFKDRVVAVRARRRAGDRGSRCSPARRRETWPTRSPRPRPGPGSAPWCSSRPTSSSRRSSPPPSTAARSSLVDGNYDDVNRLASELAGEQEDWAFVNVNVRPYYAEGSKTLGFEIAEQLGWRLPEQVVDADRLRRAAHQGGQGLPGAGRARPGRGQPAGTCSAPRPPAARRYRPPSRRARTSSRRSARPPSPSRWRSATRPTAPTCWTWCAGPAARSRT